MTMEESKQLELLDELLELVELHPRSSLNLALCGGLKLTMDIAFESPLPSARRAACGIFAFAVQNNKEVQAFARKLGALNFMQQYVRENENSNKEAVAGALSQYLKGENFEGKIEFIKEVSGLSFLREALM